MPTKISCAIFDMGGVLVDSESLINAAAIGMFRERGVQVKPEDFLPFVGQGEERYIGGVAEKYCLKLDLSAAKQRTYEIYMELIPTRLEVFPGARELVSLCRKARLKVALASSADRVKVMANLQELRLPEQIWDTVVTGEEVIRKKPAPDIFLLAARNLGLKPEACVVIEDAVQGIAAAKAAGMRCVAVAQTFPAERLQQANLVRQRISEIHLSDLAPDWGIRIALGGR